jgi:hypothetical protein
MRNLSPPINEDTSDVFEFDAGDDWTWDTGDDNIPGWSRAEPRDMYAVAVSDSEIINLLSPPFSVISGKTWSDNESEESYHYSSNKIRSWSTGVIWSADATYDDNWAYNFRLFGSFSPDNNVTLVAQNSDNIIDYYTTGGTVNAVAISFSYISEEIYGSRFDYFVAGSADDSVYFFTYDY